MSKASVATLLAWFTVVDGNVNSRDHKAVPELSNFTTDKLVLYPNPTHDYIRLNIPGNFDAYEYEIIDLTGKKLMKNTNRDSMINVQSLSSGIYIIKVKAVDKEYSTKFVKE